MNPFVAYGRVLASKRKKVYCQIHFGADYEGGTFGCQTVPLWAGAYGISVHTVCTG